MDKQSEDISRRTPVRERLQQYLPSDVTYWPSTKPSIKRFTCVTAKKVHPVEDIGISPWPVDVDEFGTDTCAHRKQVDVRQLYSQLPQMAWVSSVPVAVLDRMPAEWETAPSRESWALSDPRLNCWAKMRKKCCYGREKRLGQCVAVCLRFQLTSHT